MIRWLDDLGYRMCWKTGWLAWQWARLFYHYRCPYPITEARSARKCAESGECGCNNGPRLAPHLYPQEKTDAK